MTKSFHEILISSLKMLVSVIKAIINYIVAMNKLGCQIMNALIFDNIILLVILD
jgi:hypothetical protein